MNKQLAFHNIENTTFTIMKYISTSELSRKYLLLWMSLTILRAGASEHSCVASSTPCQAGCWNPSARIQPNGLRLCETVSTGYYSPDGDDAQYACQSHNLERLLRGATDCSPSIAIHPDPADNSTRTEVDQYSRHSDQKQSNLIESLIYVLIFSLLAVCFVYVRARVIDCRTRRKNRNTRAIPPPPTDPKPKPTMSQSAVADNTTELGHAAAEGSVAIDIEQG